VTGSETGRTVTPQLPTSPWSGYVFAVALIGAAALLRVWPLHALGSSLTWLTFYPAVMIVAIYGGLYCGLLATALACLTVTYLWPFLVETPFIKSPADLLGVGVFVLTGSMISGVAEAMRRANARAKAAQEQAEAASRAKSAFLATMSHELRTPLNAILGFSDIMRRDPSVAEAHRANLDIINRSGAHLLSLINDILDMAKIEAGQLLLHSETVDAHEMIDDIAAMLRGQAEDKGLSLTLDRANTFPRFIACDVKKVRQIIVNLAGNAIKFTSKGGVTLRFRHEEGRMIVFVEDTGIGIRPEDQKAIFDPFVQAGKPATQKGTGLGLAIVREFLEAMGGTIDLESVPDKGSTFRVTIPAPIASGAEVASPVHPKSRVIGLAPDQPPFRVLIVEDQVENQLLLRNLLEGVGFIVEVSNHGGEAVDAFPRFKPQFIWMDRRMPVMDGLEATRRIRALEGGKEVKIVAVTASVFEDQREEMIAQGMDGFVRKPFVASEIFDCMEALLGVRYDLETAADPEEPSASASLPDLLASLPETLRGALSDALTKGDTDEIAGMMPRLERAAPTLPKTLARHLENFDYLPILQALESAKSKT